jgi:hypothetical protein
VQLRRQGGSRVTPLHQRRDQRERHGEDLAVEQAGVHRTGALLAPEPGRRGFNRVLAIQQGVQLGFNRVLAIQQGVQLGFNRVLAIQQGVQLGFNRVLAIQQGVQLGFATSPTLNRIRLSIGVLQTLQGGLNHVQRRALILLWA